MGDVIIIGNNYGKVRMIKNDWGKVLKEVTPAMAAEIVII